MVETAKIPVALRPTQPGRRRSPVFRLYFQAEQAMRAAGRDAAHGCASRGRPRPLAADICRAAGFENCGAAPQFHSLTASAERPKRTPGDRHPETVAQLHSFTVSQPAAVWPNAPARIAGPETVARARSFTVSQPREFPCNSARNSLF